MSKDKYLSIHVFSHLTEAVVIFLQIFFAISTVLKIGQYHLDIPQHYLAREFSVT